MCNKYRSRLAIEALLGGFPDLRTPGGLPNLEPREEISITDTAPIIHLDEGAAPVLTQMRWSWPGPGGKPVYNFRSEGRRFTSGRCLIPADGFYEFTDPDPPAPKRARKTRWLFTMTGEPWFCIAGVMRDGAWSMLTVEPGPDIAPYHSRQVVVLGPSAWRTWLGGDQPEAVLRPAPAGTLQVERVS